MRILFLALLYSGLLAPSAHARPVSYPGGWTAMFMNDGQRHSAHLHYSPKVDLSIGYKFEDWRDLDFTLHAMQINNLLKRWNEKHSQANFYLKSGIGVARADGGNENELAVFSGIALDWEDRRRFISYQNRYTDAGSINDFFQQSVRVGWAPYEGDYGDLHTWLMVEIQHSPEADDTITTTPLVRFFKSTHMVEAGVSNNGDVMLNYIYRY